MSSVFLINIPRTSDVNEHNFGMVLFLEKYFKKLLPVLCFVYLLNYHVTVASIVPCITLLGCLLIIFKW